MSTMNNHPGKMTSTRNLPSKLASTRSLGGSTRNLTRSKSVRQEKVVVNLELKAKGIKHGVRYVERSHFLDEEGDFRESEMHWREDRRHCENSCLQGIVDCFIWMRCIPPDPADVKSIKTLLLWAQWLALICDVVAAIVAIVTFQGITYCCGTPILDIAGTIPWKTTTRVLTYVYLFLIFMEVYPVVRKGFPFNLVNPLIGFLVTFAMFFTDTKLQALMMWFIETAAILCEFTLFRLKVRQIAIREKEIVVVGRKTKKTQVGEDEDPEAAAQALTEARQRYYQLKQDQLNDHTLVWYLRVGCYLNIVLSLITLIFILFVAQGGGLCINNFQVPNPFDLDQIGRCPLCANETGTCEICEDNVKQCYYPYS